MKRKSVIKLVVSALMVLFLLRFVDLSTLASTILSIPVWTACIVVAGYLIGQLVSAGKWLLIARASGIAVSYPSALKSYFVGMFANCFGFGIVGGDLARGILLAQGRSRKLPAVATVIADRTHGLAVLALLGVVSALLFGGKLIQAELTYLLVAVGTVIALGWIVGPAVLVRLFSRSNVFGERAEQIAAAFPRKQSTIFLITVISVFFHSLQIVLHWVMGQGFGVDIPLTYLFVVIPFVNILSSLPISWNGLGVRENAYIFFLAPHFLSAEQAAAMGAVWLVAVTVSAAIGGLVAVLSHDLELLRKAEVEPPSDQTQSEPAESGLAKQTS